MSERELVRKENVPITFKKDIVQWVTCGKKCNPQLYRTSKHQKHLHCGKSHHHKCHDD